MPAAPDEKRTDLAAFLLLTTAPTDRALRGWDPCQWSEQEVAELSAYAQTTATVTG